jgi:hypothetical protein
VLCALAACDRPRTAAKREQWGPVTVAGITLATPGRLLQITTEVPAALDPAVREMVQRIDSYGRTIDDTEIRVSRVIYRPQAVLSAESSAQSALNAVRENPAIEKFTHAQARVQTSGAPSVRTSMRFDVRGQAAMGEMLTVLRGQTLWQVQVLGPVNPQTDSTAERVMQSIQLAPEAGGVMEELADSPRDP